MVANVLDICISRAPIAVLTISYNRVHGVLLCGIIVELYTIFSIF